MLDTDPLLLDDFSNRALPLTTPSVWRPAEVVLGERVGAESGDGSGMNCDIASGVAVVDIEEMVEDEGF
jgi:hypothetical protein